MSSGLLQSREEWGARNRVLSGNMAELINRYAAPGSERGIEVGCMHGDLTEEMVELTSLANWTGVDPLITEPTHSPKGLELLPGRADSIPFADETFDAVLFANVYEHVSPETRGASMVEMRRVLKPGGIVAGQLPNPYFPIESHSRLPFMGWLPVRAQKAYWRFAPVDWEHDFYVVTIRHLRKTALAAGFEIVLVRNFNYPLEVIPESVRWAARALERPMRRFPWAWQFVLRRPR